jgi:hypothetical protein
VLREQSRVNQCNLQFLRPEDGALIAHGQDGVKLLLGLAVRVLPCRSWFESRREINRLSTVGEHALFFELTGNT